MKSKYRILFSSTFFTLLLNITNLFLDLNSIDLSIIDAFITIITIMAFITCKYGLDNNKSNYIVLELYGLNILFFISFIRFLNKLLVIPDIFNILFFLLSIFFIALFIYNLIKRNNLNKI